MQARPPAGSSRDSERQLTDTGALTAVSETRERADDSLAGVGPEAALPRPARRRILAIAGWAGLLAVLLTLVGGLLWRRFYYGNDDLLQFSDAQENGLSWPYLSLNVFQHFAPYNRVAHWLVVRFTDLDPAPGLGLVLLNCGLMLAACLWLMTELRLSTTRRALALIAIALAVPVTETAVWFDAGMHILPAIAVTAAVCAAHVRGVRTGRRRWHALALLLFVAGQVTQERPVFALPLVVLVDVLLVWRSLPWRTRLRRLWQLRGPLTALLLAAVGIAAALQTFVVLETTTPPSWWVTAEHLLMAVTNFAVPAMVNQPLEQPTDATVQWLILGGILVLGLVLALARRHNAGPLLFVAAVFLLYYGFLKFSPLLEPGQVPSQAARLQNAVYATVPATIGLAHVRLPRLRRRPQAQSPGVARRWRVRSLLHVAGCLGLAAYLAVSNDQYLDRSWAETTEARAYLDRVRGTAAQWSSPDVSVVPLFGHPAMATSWSVPFSRNDVLLGIVYEGFIQRDPGRDLVLLDDRGVPRPAALDTVREFLDPVGGACADFGRRFLPRAGMSAPAVGREPMFLRLEYRASEDVDVAVTRRPGAWSPDPGNTRLPGGSHTRLIPVVSPRLAAVDLELRTPGALMCIRGASLVRPVLVQDAGRTCRAVDWYGEPLNTVDCPD